MRCSSLLARAILTGVVTAGSVVYANAQQFQAVFSGLNENPSINSPAQGSLRLTLNTQLQSIDYTLTYSNLVGAVAQAHIHFARPRVNGAIVVFLCTNLGNGPAGTPPCPAAPATVTGMITPASVLAVPGQGIAAGDFAAVTNALKSQASYGNVHSTTFPGGEIRGEIVQCPPSGCPPLPQ
jgi:CHRD domain